ncbi:AraC family transcriptional regulator [Aureimonas sp. ME7]|uniref:helix-turn-helix transcriptional regulator n=1 Tax=Aureimonas sp. ME7 TaxID=2744252 RepID=UPI0015F76D84|nr:AraC family transcriptional regulator [Aureimonas sp. ME7]
MYHAVAMEASSIGGSKPSPFRSYRETVAGNDGFDRINAALTCPIRLRAVGREAPDLDLKGTIGPDVSVWRMRSVTGFESLPRFDENVYTLSVPLRGHFARDADGFAYTADASQASLIRSSRILRTRCAPRSEVVHCNIRAHALEERLEVLTGSRRPAFRPLADLSSLPMRALAHTMRRLAGDLDEGANALSTPLLHDLLLNQILAAWPQEEGWHGHGEENAARVVARSLDFIEAHLAEPITVSQIARAAAASVRTLQASFRSQTGQTPIGYILERRLERAHADLQANAGRLHVSQIAYRWGFFHLSDFSRRYRTRYGCLPSETSRRGA